MPKTLKESEIRKESETGAWCCWCDNMASTDGFQPCNEKGEEIEPTKAAGWIDLYVCGRCGIIIQQGK